MTRLTRPRSVLRPGMRTAFLCVVAGGLWSLLLAWLLVLAVPRSASRPLSLRASDAWLARTFLTPLGREQSHAGFSRVQLDRGFGVVELRADLGGFSMSEGERIVLAGWPLLAFYGSPPNTSFSTSFLVPVPGTLPLPRGMPSQHVTTGGLPGAPLGLRALGNTLFWAIVFFAMALVRRVPAFMRRRQGRCAHCAQQLLPGAAICPECGTAV